MKALNVGRLITTVSIDVRGGLVRDRVTRSVTCSWDGSRLSDVPAITSRSNAHDSRAGAGHDLGFLRQPAWRIAPSIQAESCLRGLSTKEILLDYGLADLNDRRCSS